MRHLAAFLLTLAASGAVAYTADELAAKNAAAKGTPEELAALKSVRLSGKLRVNRGPLELRYAALIRRPGSIRYEVQLQGLTRVQAFDGEQAWQINPFQGRKDPERLSADDAKGLSENAADFTGVLVDYQAKCYTLDYIGTADIDGNQADNLLVTSPYGTVTTVDL